MSSPPALDFPSSEMGDDVDMADGTTPSNQQETQTFPNAPPPTTGTPLFLAGTPSTMPGTPARRRDEPPSSPLRGVTARRALGMQTPKRTPLFAGGSSSPMAFPSSSPMKTPSQRRVVIASDRPDDSDPLDFPSTPRASVKSTPKNRRGDIHSSLSITPSASARRIARRAELRAANPNLDLNLNSDGSHPDLPPSSSAPAPGAPHGLGTGGGTQLSAQPHATDDEPDEIRAIWGTTVNIQETMKSFKDFLRGYKPKYRIAHDRTLGHPTRALASPAEGEIALYETYLRRMRQTGETNLNLDVVNLLAYPPAKKLHAQLVKYPQEVIPAMDQVLKDVMLEVAEADQEEGMEGMRGAQGDEEISEILGRIYKVRPFGLQSVNMRDLNPSDTDKLVSIKGLVIRATPIIPDMKVAFFRCPTCQHTTLAEIDRGRITQPPHCPRDSCASPSPPALIHNRCEFADRQVICLQETPDAVPDGQTPHTVSLSVYDELVDVCKPGDRVGVTGIYRSVPVRVNPRQRTLKSLFKTYLDVVHVRLGGGEGLGFDKTTRPAGGDRVPGVGVAGLGDGSPDDGEEDSSADVEGGGRQTRKAELEARLKALSQRPDIYAYLARSLAPSIWEMDDVKKGILLQLFGGTNKSVARGGGGGGPRYRGDVNVLLVGDPGVSKSQILKYVHKIAPRGVYASGKGSSAVGLTAYVTRDPETKQLVLESGALVLSDGGVCCIDEFDKMSDATRSVLHEVMEQQTVSIAKAGIITTLNARTSILAAANPVGSKYDVNLPITRNIDLPPTLISRFDLLYLVLDQVDDSLDRKLAQHLVGLYLEDEGAGGERDFLPLQDLSAYIDYARSKIHPIISESAGSELVRCYVEMRNMGSDDPRSSEKRITATTRQLESLIRLSEAHARMRFSPFVELPDVQEAARLMREAIKTSAMDPRTGKIDMGLLNTGTGTGQRKLREDMRKEILSVLDAQAKGRGVKWAELLRLLGEQSSVKVDAVEFAEVVKGLENEGAVKVVGEREKRTVRRIE